MAAKLDGPRVPPAGGGKPSKLIVLVHGYGADGNDLIALAPYLQRVLPDAAFVAPDGPSPCDMSPMGRQWFPINLDDPSRMSRDPAAALERFASMAGAADEVAPVLNGFIDDELERHGLTGQDLALIGFSQGTMMSLHIGLRRSPAPAAIVGFSGALLGPDRLETEAVNPVPVQLIHGDQDDLVPPLAMFGAAAALGRANVPVSFHISSGIGHGIAPDGIELAIRHVQRGFADRLEAASQRSSRWPRS
ncbi:alpha/beta hydrolase [Minwuia sp.]|uniref:alpha/beta hydrolase n=1 Tax=Minwuia sp. TaxID=2493630 RepID=UPI003A92D651